MWVRGLREDPPSCARCVGPPSPSLPLQDAAEQPAGRNPCGGAVGAAEPSVSVSHWRAGLGSQLPGSWLTAPGPLPRLPLLSAGPPFSLHVPESRPLRALVFPGFFVVVSVCTCIFACVFGKEGPKPPPEDCGNGTSLGGATGAAVLGCLAFCHGAWGRVPTKEVSGRGYLPPPSLL